MPSKTKRKSPTGSRPKTKSVSRTRSRTRSRTTLSPMSSTPSIQNFSREEYLDKEIKKYRRRIRECNKAITAKGTILQQGLYPIPASQFRNIVGNITAEESSPGYQQHLRSEMLRNDREREAERRVERYYDNAGAYEAPRSQGNPLGHYSSGGKSHTPGRNDDDIVIRENIQKKISILAGLKEKYKKCRLEHQRIKNPTSYVGNEPHIATPVVVARPPPVVRSIGLEGIPTGYGVNPYLAQVSVPPTSPEGPTMLEELTQLAEMEVADQQGLPVHIQPRTRRRRRPHSPLPGGYGRAGRRTRRFGPMGSFITRR